MQCKLSSASLGAQLLLRTFYAGISYVEKSFYEKSKRFLTSDTGCLGSCLEFIETSLGDLGMDKKLVLKTLMAAEEVISQFMELSVPEGAVRVRIRKLTRDAEITIAAEGKRRPRGDVKVTCERRGTLFKRADIGKPSSVFSAEC